ncbi:MAG: MBOAT family protein [Gemmataceae bacterium]|nr:MBOAT family protein [Gemmataceae bacterium]
MIFASKAFFVFLPAVLVLYHLLRGTGHKYRVLLGASWLFYAWLSPQYLWVILLCTAIDYAAALKIEATPDDPGRRRWLLLSIAANLGLLFAFKYTAFAADNAIELVRLFGLPAPDRTWDILLPLGISFHTFQGISYTVDVYRRQIAAVRSFRDYALFVAFFPQLAAGPIVRAVEFLPQMTTPPGVSAKQVADGLHLFLGGLFKKLFLADTLDQLFVSPVFADPAAYDPTAHRWACVAWAAQIYCDFSGYSDMAMGCAKWFGFELPANFDRPYLATSITDFWRRWHLSLSTWLRDYVYFPLGGSRGGPVRTYANLMAVFVMCGLWHGATWAWLVYGLYNGVLMSLHRAWDVWLRSGRAGGVSPLMNHIRETWAWKLVAWAGTFWLVTAGLILIRMPSWDAGGVLFQSLLGVDLLSGWSAAVPVWVPLFLAGIAAGHLLGGRWPVPAAVRAAAGVGMVVLLVVLGPGVGKTFIYLAF